MLARTSSEATALPIFIAAVLSLALPWILVAFTTLAVREILLLQVAAFLALAMLLCLPPVRVALMPRAARRAAAYRAATDQFVARGIARKKDRAGILIFVSLAERYARIIADEGIAARVAQPEWQGAVDALIAHMRDGRIVGGFRRRDRALRKRARDALSGRSGEARRAAGPHLFDLNAITPWRSRGAAAQGPERS